MSDLNTKVKEVENEKQSLVTVLKILHGDYVNETTNRSRGTAQVDHELGNRKTGQHNVRRKSGRNFQSQSFIDINNCCLFFLVNAREHAKCSR